MFYLLFSIAFAVIALLYALRGMRNGKKYVWSYSLARFIAVLVSAITAAFLSAGISVLKAGISASANTPLAIFSFKAAVTEAIICFSATLTIFDI